MPKLCNLQSFKEQYEAV